MWAWIIPLIVNLLIPFIEALIKRWIPAAMAPGAKLMQRPIGTSLEGNRQQFIDKVTRRFWLGPKRADYAGKLYDKAVANFNAPDFVMPMSSEKSYDANLAAQRICFGLTLSPDEM